MSIFSKPKQPDLPPPPPTPQQPAPSTMFADAERRRSARMAAGLASGTILTGPSGLGGSGSSGGGKSGSSLLGQ
jgi:hypothetical protein